MGIELKSGTAVTFIVKGERFNGTVSYDQEGTGLWYYIDSEDQRLCIHSSKVKCRHLSAKEIGMVGYYKKTEDCKHGCKVHKCESCEKEFESHSATYGCHFRGQIIPVY